MIYFNFYCVFFMYTGIALSQKDERRKNKCRFFTNILFAYNNFKTRLYLNKNSVENNR